MKTPQRGGHRKPNAAARHAPDGYEHTVDCPTCKGKGTVKKSQVAPLRALLLKKV